MSRKPQVAVYCHSNCDSSRKVSIAEVPIIISCYTVHVLCMECVMIVTEGVWITITREFPRLVDGQGSKVI